MPEDSIIAPPPPQDSHYHAIGGCTHLQLIKPVSCLRSTRWPPLDPDRSKVCVHPQGKSTSLTGDAMALSQSRRRRNRNHWVVLRVTAAIFNLLSNKLLQCIYLYIIVVWINENRNEYTNLVVVHTTLFIVVNKKPGSRCSEIPFCKQLKYISLKITVISVGECGA